MVVSPLWFPFYLNRTHPLNRILFSSASVHWRTPSTLYEALNEEFNFTYDPCPIEGEDGLACSWEGNRVYCNPPYGPKVRAFLEKAKEATLAVYLLPARTDTKWFHEIVLPLANDIRFIKERRHFHNKGPAPFPSMIVVFNGHR